MNVRAGRHRCGGLRHDNDRALQGRFKRTSNTIKVLAAVLRITRVTTDFSRNIETKKWEVFLPRLHRFEKSNTLHNHLPGGGKNIDPPFSMYF